METRLGTGLTKDNFLFWRPKLFLNNFFRLGEPQRLCKVQQSEEFIERIRLEKESAVNRLGSCKSKDD